jgi:phosphomannomutase
MSSLLSPQQFAIDFVAAYRGLSAANSLSEFQSAAPSMNMLLDQVDAFFKSGEMAAWQPTDSARIFSALLTLMAECPQYRHETIVPRHEIIAVMSDLRVRVIGLGKAYLSQPAFAPLVEDLNNEIFPILDQMLPNVAPDRYMPFRVIHVGNVAERIIGFKVRTSDPALKALIQAIYDRKYLRFGTSGVRGRWGRDFTERRAKQVVQAVCEYLKDLDTPAHAKGENLSGKKIIIGYDSRRNANKVAAWVAEVCLANGFSVDLTYRDTPTPASVFYETDYLDPAEVAGMINCTASHNPPEWQGLKFNPRLGYPAPTNVTDFIAARINEIQMLDRAIPTMSLEEGEKQGMLRGFDPIAAYTKWVMQSGEGNQRLKLDFDRMRRYFSDKFVVVDEMHGASRGYLPRLLGEIGIRHVILHPETDPTLPGLDYANPEEPYINQLKAKVKESGAALGVGMDTDSDRFGVVDVGGEYLRPNQILPILIRYLGVDRGLRGRIIATQTGSPLIEIIAEMMPNNAAFKPGADVIPAYIDHPFYHRKVGNREDRVFKHTFMVPVGIKYIEEQRRTDNKYKGIKDKDLPANWRDIILIGGEESSGLTTRGHVTDKDGIWANLLIMDMVAYYGTRAENPLHSVREIWEETCKLPGCWVTYGGREPESNTGRSDVDAVLEAKEALINDYLEAFGPGKENKLEGLDVVYAGGVRYDIAEMQLKDASGDDRHYLRVRSSGTEPINRIYVESSNPAIAKKLMHSVLARLESLIMRELVEAPTEWRFVDVLTVTKLTDSALQAAKDAIAKHGWEKSSVLAKLTAVVNDTEYLEGRNRRMTARWLERLNV